MGEGEVSYQELIEKYIEVFEEIELILLEARQEYNNSLDSLSKNEFNQNPDEIYKIANYLVKE